MKSIIPANTYTGQTVDAPGAAVVVTSATRADLPDDLVYGMTKAIFESLPDLASSHAAAKSIKLENALQGMPVPAHPGAEKYFRETGLTK